MDYVVENVPELAALRDALVKRAPQGVAVKEVAKPGLGVVPLAIHFEWDRLHGEEDGWVRGNCVGDEDASAIHPGEGLGIGQRSARSVAEVRGKEYVAEGKAEAGLEGRHRNLLGAIRVARMNPAL